MLKEQIEVLLRENNILKRAVAIQHERQKEYDDRNQEVQHLKQLVSQYQEQLRTLEVQIKLHLPPFICCHKESGLGIHMHMKIYQDVKTVGMRKNYV